MVDIGRPEGLKYTVIQGAKREHHPKNSVGSVVFIFISASWEEKLSHAKHPYPQWDYEEFNPAPDIIRATGLADERITIASPEVRCAGNATWRCRIIAYGAHSGISAMLSKLARFWASTSVGATQNAETIYRILQRVRQMTKGATHVVLRYDHDAGRRLDPIAKAAYDRLCVISAIPACLVHAYVPVRHVQPRWVP